MFGRVRTLNFGSIIKTLNEESLAERLTDTQIFTSEFIIYFNTGNSSDIYFGGSKVDNTWIPRIAGTSSSYFAEDIPGEPRAFDLSRLYISGTLGDGVIIQYRTED